MTAKDLVIMNKKKIKENKGEVADSLVGILKLRYENENLFSNDKIRKTDLQTSALIELFKISNFPSTETREEIAILLGLPQRSVQIWFQNRRQQYKKVNKEDPVAKYQEAEHHNFPQVQPVHIDTNEIPTSVIVDVILSCKKAIEEDFYSFDFRQYPF